jgi:hypothetical protein
MHGLNGFYEMAPSHPGRMSDSPVLASPNSCVGNSIDAEQLRDNKQLSTLLRRPQGGPFAY